MKLELNGNKLSLGDKEIKLPDEQLKEMGIYLEPFDIHYGDKIFYIKTSGDIDNTIFNSYYNEHTKLLKSGKICKDEKLIEQKALHQNLNDLLWQFTNENG
ncbi:MAG: hypothetical protein K2L15_02465 [Eubacteriales bacterium]|nr:hypothetical protein [Eubacteriales bacterium]